MNSILDDRVDEGLESEPSSMEPTNARRKTRRATAFTVAVLLLTLLMGGLAGRYIFPTRTQTLAVAPTGAAAPPAVTPAGADTSSANKNPAQPSFDFARDVIHGGEGIAHPAARILMEHPELIPGGFKGDPNDKAALKKWAGIQAYLLEYRGGLIGPHFHEDIRILHPDTVAVQIEKNPDGSLRIALYAVQNRVMATSPVVIHNVAPTIASAHFIGPQDGTTALPAPYRAIEYMNVPN